MTKEDKLKIEFYKNGAAEAVLKRFMFTEKEKKLIQDAIRTANMPNPRMKLIDEVDVLLKDVAKFREPIIIEQNDKDAAKATAIISTITSEYNSKQAIKGATASMFGKREILFAIAMILMGITIIKILT
jgi:fibrillarin-like rRNA methylase